jgi:hypothetical protein
MLLLLLLYIYIYIYIYIHIVLYVLCCNVSLNVLVLQCTGVAQANKCPKKMSFRQGRSCSNNMVM